MKFLWTFLINFENIVYNFWKIFDYFSKMFLNFLKNVCPRKNPGYAHAFDKNIDKHNTPHMYFSLWFLIGNMIPSWGNFRPRIGKITSKLQLTGSMCTNQYFEWFQANPQIISVLCYAKSKALNKCYLWRQIWPQLLQLRHQYHISYARYLTSMEKPSYGIWESNFEVIS